MEGVAVDDAGSGMMVTVLASEAVLVASQETDEVVDVLEKCHVHPRDEYEEDVDVESHSAQLVLEVELDAGDAVVDGSQSGQVVEEEIEVGMEDTTLEAGSQSGQVVDEDTDVETGEAVLEDGSQSGQMVDEDPDVETGDTVLDDRSEGPQLVLEEVEELTLEELEVVDKLVPVG